jgi:hypothetical protein
MTAMAVNSNSSGDDSMTAAAAPAPAPAPIVVAARAVAAAFIVTALLLIGALSLLNDAAWWRGLGAATVATLMAAVATIPIIAWGMRVAPARPELSAAAFFIAAGARAIVTLSAAMLAIKFGGYPKTPTALLVLPYYFALLAAETICLARILWTRAPQPKGTTTEEKHDD